MKMLWEGMGNSKFPKIHLLFDHAADEQKKWGRLGDKGEDPFEKRHQIQMAYDSLYKRLRQFRQRLENQSHSEFRTSHPGVNETIEQVRDGTRKKKCTNNHEGGDGVILCSIIRQSKKARKDEKRRVASWELMKFIKRTNQK